MTQWKLLGSTALVALIAGNAASAEVTAEEVWQSWKDMAASYGQTITTTSEVRNGDALVVEGATYAVDQDGVAVNMTVPQMTFTETGDGSVDVTLTDSYPMTIKTAAEGEVAASDVTITISHPGLVVTASGTTEETRYDFDAPELSVALAEVKADKPVDLSVALKMTGMVGNYILSGTDTKSASSSYTAAGMDLTLAGADPETPGSKFNVTGSVKDLSGTGNSKLAGDFADMAAAIKAGFATDGSMTYGVGTFAAAITDATGDMKVDGTTEGGSITYTISQAGMGYGGTGKAVSLVASGAQIPFPELKISYGESAFNFLMPVAAGDAPSDFALVTKLIDLTISDKIWGMFDPTSQLPRDPMTVVLDTSGTAKLFADIMDPAAMEAIGEAAPGEIHSLDLNALQVKLAGAELTGTGALTFDNTDMTTFAGVPAPTGKVELKAVGVNGLMDKLVAMGLLPEDQVMGARMMMGMFAKVVEGEADTLTSTLEFKDKGFFANGMQLQ